jgi:hypothetical protein
MKKRKVGLSDVTQIVGVDYVIDGGTTRTV